MSHTCRFSAVVFDMDGILIDSEGIWDEVRRGLARAENLSWPDEATPAMMGMSTPEWAAYLSETVGLTGTPEEIADRVIDGVADRYAEHLPAIAGGAEAVRRMAEDHVVGVASSSPRRLIDLVIHELGLDGLFAATVSTEEVAAGKPAPDGYLRACELLGVKPRDAVGIEDSTNGLKSLHNAGMAVIHVPPSFHAPTEEVRALADAIIPSLDELTEDLLTTL
jgi:HAD superfamily hydrolase (TIGR01509 family)